MDFLNSGSYSMYRILALFIGCGAMFYVVVTYRKELFYYLILAGTTIILLHWMELITFEINTEKFRSIAAFLLNLHPYEYLAGVVGFLVGYWRTDMPTIKKPPPPPQKKKRRR